MRIRDTRPPVEMTGKIMRETTAAILFQVKGHKIFGNREMWLPKSQLPEIHREKEATRVKVPAWLLEKKIEEFGLVGDDGDGDDADPGDFADLQPL